MATPWHIFVQSRFSAPTKHPGSRKNRSSRNIERAESGYAVSVKGKNAKTVPMCQIFFFPDSFLGECHKNLK